MPNWQNHFGFAGTEKHVESRMTLCCTRLNYRLNGKRKQSSLSSARMPQKVVFRPVASVKQGGGAILPPPNFFFAPPPQGWSIL